MGNREPEHQDINATPDSWVDRFGDYLFSYAMMRLSDRETARDVVQETFLSAIKAIDSFDRKSSLRTWLVSILKRKIVDHFRKISRQAEYEEQVMTQSAQDYFSEGERSGAWRPEKAPLEWSINPEDKVETAEFWKFLHLCLSDLPRKYSIPFILREMEELESEEICNVLEIEATNLRVTMFRARNALRKCLEKNWIEKTDE